MFLHSGGAAINETPIASLAVLFGDLEDPRHALGRRHQLLDIIATAICAILSGADTWVDVAAYGRAKEAWLGTFLELPHGVPSHDTFARVFAALDGEQFQACFMQWVQAVVKVMPGQVIAIDGKTACASHDGPDASIATHMVSAWATANGVVLDQVAVNEKSNEITAIPSNSKFRVAEVTQGHRT